MSNNHRFKALDGIRGIAAIAVVIFHTTKDSRFSLFGSAVVSVDLFFCLSGFVICYAYRDKFRSGLTVKEFVLRRLARLYPMFIVGILIGSVALMMKIAVGQSDIGYPRAIAAILLNACYMPFISDFSVRIALGSVDSAIFPTDDPAWSLFFELLVNLVFAVIAARLCIRKAGVITLIGGATFFAYALHAHNLSPGWSHDNALDAVPRTIFGFFSGVFVFLLAERVSGDSLRCNPSVLLTGVVAFFVLAALGPVAHVLALVLMPVVVFYAARTDITSHELCNQLEFIGRISYPLYCIHYPIYSVMTSLAGDAAGSIAVSMMACLTSVATATALAILVEPHAHEA